MSVWLIWAILLVLIIILLIYRISLTSSLEEFSGSHDNPRVACDKLNRGLFAELAVHSVITFCFLLFPNRSYVLFVLNLPRALWGWYLLWREQFYFSPFHIVRDIDYHSNVSICHTTLFILDVALAAWKLLQSVLFY
jgi:hypothetical protein